MNISGYLEIKRDIVEHELQNIINGLRITRLDKVSSNRDIHLYKTNYLQQILDEYGDLNSSEMYYATLYFNQWMSKIIETLHKLYLKRNTITENVVKLKQLVLPEQRSQEWYDIRENLLTASSLADALGKGHFQTRDDLLISKTCKDPKPFEMNHIMQWGVKYEPVATEFYEKLNNLRIVEFGLIPHPELKEFGASPDGICDVGSPNGYEGRMLEIKCPPKRAFTEEVPIHYWMQMQGQLEVCDLEECDFLQVKLEEYVDVGEYEKDLYYTDKLVHGKTKDGLPKGLVIAYRLKYPNSDKYDIEYKYSPWGASLDEVGNWKDTTIKELNETYSQSDKIFSLYEVKWWKITRYECTLVRRDREWWLSTVPEIIKFWKEVVHYREVGNEEVQKRIDSRKRKRNTKPKQVVTIPDVSDEYQMLDTDEEDTK